MRFIRLCTRRTQMPSFTPVSFTLDELNRPFVGDYLTRFYRE
jgi:hypothetical protein